MNGQRISYFNQNQDAQALVEGTNSHFIFVFHHFLDKFRREQRRVYHRSIEEQFQFSVYVLEIKVADLKAFEQLLYEKLIASPLEMVKVMEKAVRAYAFQKQAQFHKFKDVEWQVNITSDQIPTRLRDIKSNMVYRLFVIKGIIISTTKPYIKATRLKIKCKNCLAQKIVELSPGQTPYIPYRCEGLGGTNMKCPNDPFIAMPDSDVIDTQNIKIQQNPEDVPTGEIARTYSLVADRENVMKLVPGDRAVITGIMLVQDLSHAQNLSKGYMYVTGIEKLNERSSFLSTPEEQTLFKELQNDSKLRERIYRSIAPGIFGNQDIKKAIACMLFGGSRKYLPDKTTLRGDINILLIGDPSTAKSQFLKFVEQTASIAVYTSGKGSSAAGLTASITKDSSTGQFQIEGGALVLADGGIVCIDEFDKMKPQDRVAIHEAMEQQTISVAKAGITTRLNSRASVLAAANPIYGRYDELKQISQQIELQTTILSRFDCIFVVRDINTAENNNRIASHILDLHQGKITRKTEESDVDFQTLKRYIRYARLKCHPRLSAVASEKMQQMYVIDRQKAKEHSKLTQSKNSIPITVRQLQALIRLSESLARMKLKHEVTIEEVEEAHSLFKQSTLKSIQGKEFGYELSENISHEIQKIQDAMRKRVCIGSQVYIAKIIEQMQGKFSQSNIAYALRNMVMNGQFREIKGKKQVLREK